MKSYLLIFFVFLNSICFSQTISGNYVQLNIKGVGDDEQLSDYAKEANIYSYIYSNLISKQELISKGGVKIDSISTHNEKYNLDFISERKTIKPQKTIFIKNYSNNIFESFFLLDNDEYYIKDELPSFEWKISNERKKINGLNCRKASTIKKSFGLIQNIIAWYCEDIPINDGPLDFNGLPGLIVEIEADQNLKIKLINISLNENTTSKIEQIQTNIQPISIKELENKWK